MTIEKGLKINTDRVIPEESLNVLLGFFSGSGGVKQAASAAAKERAAAVTGLLAAAAAAGVADVREAVEAEEKVEVLAADWDDEFTGVPTSLLRRPPPYRGLLILGDATLLPTPDK